MASKAIKGYKFLTGGKSRSGIIGVKPKSGGVVDEFKARKLKQLGKTQRTLKSQDKQISTEIDKAKKRGASRKDLVKGRKFQRDSRRAQREGDKLRKDVLRIGRARGGMADPMRPKDKRKPRGPRDEGERRKLKPTPGRPAPKLREQIEKAKPKPKPGIPVGGKLKKPKPGSQDYQTMQIMKPPYKRKEMKKGGKALKPVDKQKNPGLAKLPTHVRNKMGYMKKGGRVRKFGGGKK
jgi:hypothetical protein